MCRFHQDSTKEIIQQKPYDWVLGHAQEGDGWLVDDITPLTIAIAKVKKIACLYLRDLTKCTKEMLRLAREHQVSIAMVNPSNLSLDQISHRSCIAHYVLDIANNALRAKCEHLIIAYQHTDDCIQITWMDDGIGMEESELKKVFDPFYTTQNKAVGLGLPLAKWLCETHQGTCTMTSKRKQGSQVIMRMVPSCDLYEGNLAEVIGMILIEHPTIDLQFYYNHTSCHMSYHHTPKESLRYGEIKEIESYIIKQMVL